MKSSISQHSHQLAYIDRSRDAHIFPPESYPALDTIYIPYGVVTSRHLAITRLPFDDVYPTSPYRVSFYPTLRDRPGEISHSLKEIRPAVLSIERLSENM